MGEQIGGEGGIDRGILGMQTVTRVRIEEKIKFVGYGGGEQAGHSDRSHSHHMDREEETDTNST